MLQGISQHNSLMLQMWKWFFKNVSVQLILYRKTRIMSCDASLNMKFLIYCGITVSCFSNWRVSS